MKFQKTKGFIIGVVLTMAFMTAISPALAETFSAIFNSFNIVINDEKIATAGNFTTLKDGTKVPFSMNYNNTIYLPIEILATKLGKKVDVDKKISTISITDVEEADNILPGEVDMRTRIGAPGVGLPDIYKGYDFYFEVNSADGVEVTWVAKNNTKKRDQVLYAAFFYV